jgi:hypothetical protein
MVLKYESIVKEKEKSIIFRIDDKTKTVAIPRSQICSAIRDDRNWVEIGFRFAYHNGLYRFAYPVKPKDRGETVWISFLRAQEKPKSTKFWFEIDNAKIHVPNNHIKRIVGYRAEIDTAWAEFDRLTRYEVEAPHDRND